MNLPQRVRLTCGVLFILGTTILMFLDPLTFVVAYVTFSLGILALVTHFVIRAKSKP